jgi:hypothetical protein
MPSSLQNRLSRTSFFVCTQLVTYVTKSFEDKVSIENQKELIIKITNKQIANKKNIEKSRARLFAIPNPPTSHFIIGNELSTLLDSIELNGYITTYNKINDKNNIPSTLYAWIMDFVI